MKKIAILLFLFFTTGALCVFASQWAEVCDKIYVKIEKYESNKVYYWVKILNKGKTKPINSKKVMHEMIYEVSDCSNNTIWLQNYYAYGPSGEVLDSSTSNYPDFQQIVPQSVGEALHNYVCGYNNN